MKIAFVHNLQRSKNEEEAEFDTPEVIAHIAGGLKDSGHDVTLVEMTPDATWIEQLQSTKFDIVFNTAEGYRGVGRESYAPIVFEQLGLPYVGSGPYACFLTLDKFLTKQVVNRFGVPVPYGFFVTQSSDLKELKQELSFPLFVKPNFEGSSKGITSDSKCDNFEALMKQSTSLLEKYPEGILVESFIPGKDITVPFVAGIGQDGVLEPVEYVGPKDKDEWIYNYDLKNTLDDQVGVRCPADVSENVRKKVLGYMKKAVRALSVSDMGRADFRVTPNGDVYFLELNALPSLQPGAGLFEASSKLGLSYSQTLGQIVSASQKRLKLRSVKSPSRRSAFHKPKIALVYNLKRKKEGDEQYEDEAEFDSQSTIDALLKAITGLGYHPIPLEANADLLKQLRHHEIHVVFNIAEGAKGKSREAQVPAMCDLLGIEHTGSDATCLAITLDKALSGKIVSSEGVKVPQSLLISSKMPKSVGLKFPIIVKPNMEGTSKGIYADSVVDSPQALGALIDKLSKNYSGQILLQEYIQGRELTVGVLGNSKLKVLRPLEIVFKERAGTKPVYSFEHKQLSEQLENEYLKMECPADITETQWKAVKTFAQKVFRSLGCRDFARIDFRLTQEGELYFIEVNPLPGLSPGFSDLTIMADKQGLPYDKLVNEILSPALRRWRRRSYHT